MPYPKPFLVSIHLPMSNVSKQVCYCSPKKIFVGERLIKIVYFYRRYISSEWMKLIWDLHTWKSRQVSHRIGKSAQSNSGKLSLKRFWFYYYNFMYFNNFFYRLDDAGCLSLVPRARPMFFFQNINFQKSICRVSIDYILTIILRDYVILPDCPRLI